MGKTLPLLPVLSRATFSWTPTSHASAYGAFSQVRLVQRARKRTRAILIGTQKGPLCYSFFRFFGEISLRQPRHQ